MRPPYDFQSLHDAISAIFDTLCNEYFGLQIHGLYITVRNGKHPAVAGEPLQVRSFFINERGRFRIWTSSAGAHRNHNDRASLDYRLRDAFQVRSTLLELLQDLESFLAEGL